MVSYSGLPVPEGNVPVLKIHGSCNFLPPSFVRNIAFDISAAGPDSSILDGAPHVASSTREVLDFCNSDTAFAPAIALYAPSKRLLYLQSFIERQRRDWLQAAARASAIFIIGVRVHAVDDHVWGPIAHANAPVYYVGRDTDSFRDWAASARGGKRGSFVLADSFEAAIPGLMRRI